MGMRGSTGAYVLEVEEVEKRRRFQETAIPGLAFLLKSSTRLQLSCFHFSLTSLSTPSSNLRQTGFSLGIPSCFSCLCPQLSHNTLCGMA